MTAMECYQCGCHESSRWVCLDCNNKLPVSAEKQQILELKDLKQFKDLSTIKKKHLFSTSQKQVPNDQRQPFSNESILCQQHGEPITFYHQQKHQLFCALCLFDTSISKQIIKPYGLTPIRSSFQLVFKQFKNTMYQITELSKNLDQDLKKSINYQRSIERQKKYIEISVSQTLDQMIQVIKIKQQEMQVSMNSKLSEQLEIYTLHEHHLGQLKNNIKQLKILGNKKHTTEIKIEELVYLFEAAKAIKKSLKGDAYKIQDFHPQGFNIKGLETERQQFQRLVAKIFSWTIKKDTKNKIYSQGITKRDKEKGITSGYLERSKKIFK